MIKSTYLIFIDESLLRSKAIFSRFFVFLLALVFTSFHTLANEAETINYENLLSELNKQNKFIQDTISNLETTSERLRELETLAKENKRLEFELATARNKIEKNKQAYTAINMQKEAYKSIIKALRKNLDDAEKELAKQKDNSTKTDLLKAERQIALLNQQLSEVRKQLVKLDELLSLSEEREQEQKAQLKNVGSRLNQALASLAEEERKRRKLEESERERLEEEISKLTNQTSNNSSEYFTGGIRIQSISSEPLTKFQEEFDFSYCYVGIEIYFENNEKKLFEIYLEQIDNQGIVLTDAGTLISQNYQTLGKVVFVKLVVLNELTGSCLIIDKKHIFPVIEKRSLGQLEISQSNRIAVLDDRGNLTLKNIPNSFFIKN